MNGRFLFRLRGPRLNRSQRDVRPRTVAIQRPRVRTAEGEIPLPTFQTMAGTDPIDRRVVEQMLVGVATRQYARSLEPLGADVESRGTSKSAVSRRFVAKTRALGQTHGALSHSSGISM